jgi:hypothetical protein
MKLFVSHSWQDKTIAHRIAESMGNGADVWLDVNQLKPGDTIQLRIDEALATRDVMVLVWSAAAVQSKGVAAEIDTAVRLKLRLLPVLIDNTSVDRHPQLAGLYGVDYDSADDTAGLMRIQAAIARLMMGEMEIEDSQALNALTRFEGMHQYLAGYRNKRGISGEDSLQWATQAMQSCNEAVRSVGQLRDKVGETLKVMQDTLGEVQAAGDNRQKLEDVLQRLRRRPDSESKEFKTLVDFIEGKLSTLSDQDAPITVPTIERSLRDDTPKVAMRQADANLELVTQYIRIAPASLSAFTRLAQASGSYALQAVSSSLATYLKENNDVVPDSTHPILGQMDDAWLIHNTIYRCIEAQLFAADAIAVDWNTVIAGDPIVLRLLPPLALSQLEAGLMQFMQTIASEQQSYQPSFIHQALTGAYAAFMGQGNAAGSAWAHPQQTQTIDDIYYTVGGKSYFMTGG